MFSVQNISTSCIVGPTNCVFSVQNISTCIVGPTNCTVISVQNISTSCIVLLTVLCLVYRIYLLVVLYY